MPTALIVLFGLFGLGFAHESLLAWRKQPYRAPQAQNDQNASGDVIEKCHGPVPTTATQYSVAQLRHFLGVILGFSQEPRRAFLSPSHEREA
jgi:hypothetical protein